MKLDLRPITLRLKKPLNTSRGPLKERVGLELRVEHEGLVGRGEAFPLQAFGTESFADAESVLKSLTVEPIESIDELGYALTSLEASPEAQSTIGMTAESTSIETYSAFPKPTPSRTTSVRLFAAVSVFTSRTLFTASSATPSAPTGTPASSASGLTDWVNTNEVPPTATRPKKTSTKTSPSPWYASGNGPPV